MDKKLKTARLAGWIFGTLFVVAVGVILYQHAKLAELESPLNRNLSAQQDIIREDCSAKDAESQARCADDLQKLADLLAQFSKSVVGTSTPIHAGTSDIEIQPIPTKK